MVEICRFVSIYKNKLVAECSALNRFSLKYFEVAKFLLMSKVHLSRLLKLSKHENPEVANSYFSIITLKKYTLSWQILKALGARV
jgi:hypothetical protein